MCRHICSSRASHTARNVYISRPSRWLFFLAQRFIHNCNMHKNMHSPQFWAFTQVTFYDKFIDLHNTFVDILPWILCAFFVLLLIFFGGFHFHWANVAGALCGFPSTDYIGPYVRTINNCLIRFFCLYIQLLPLLLP